MRYYLFEPKLFTARFPTGPAGEVLEYADRPKLPQDHAFAVVPRDVDRQPTLASPLELHDVIGNSIHGLIVSTRLRNLLQRFQLDDGLAFGPCTIIDRMNRWAIHSYARLSSPLGTRSVIDLDAARVHFDHEGRIYQVFNWALDGGRIPAADLFFAEKHKFIVSEHIVAACREHDLVGCKFTELPVTPAATPAAPIWGETINLKTGRRREQVKQLAASLDGRPEGKVLCRVCGQEILTRTALKTDGRCRNCERDGGRQENRQALDEYEAWVQQPLTRPEFDSALNFEDLDDLIGVFHDKAAWRMLEHPPTPGELMIVVAETFFAEVNNGGIYQFLTNPSGELTPHLPETFRSLNLPQLVALVDEVAAIIPEHLRANPRSINTHLDSIDSNWFGRIDARFFTLTGEPDASLYACRCRMRDYIAAHPDDFVHA